MHPHHPTPSAPAPQPLGVAASRQCSKTQHVVRGAVISQEARSQFTFRGSRNKIAGGAGEWPQGLQRRAEPSARCLPTFALPISSLLEIRGGKRNQAAGKKRCLRGNVGREMRQWGVPEIEGAPCPGVPSKLEKNDQVGTKPGKRDVTTR